MAAKLKKGDKVVVIAGKDKGRQGEITRVIPADNKAVVSGVNVAIRHTRQSQTSQGGRIAKEMPIEKWYRDLRIQRIWEGSDEMNLSWIFRSLREGRSQIGDVH